MTLADTTTLGYSGPRSNGSEEVLHIPQSSRTGALPSDDFVSYPGHLWGFYPSAEMQSVYSAVPVDWAGRLGGEDFKRKKNSLNQFKESKDLTYIHKDIFKHFLKSQTYMSKDIK